MSSHPTPSELLAQFPRFWSKVTIGNPDECWPWQGVLDKDGYGQFKYEGGTKRTHRVAYQQCAGPIPQGLRIDHLCRTPPCVNPGHLEAVTGWENRLRGTSLAAQHAKKTQCERGHPFDLFNTFNAPNGSRQCRTCMRERQRKGAWV